MSGAEGAPHGGEGEEEKAKMKALLTVLREIVRVGQIMKELDILIAKTEGWNAADRSKIDAAAVESAVRV